MKVMFSAGEASGDVHAAAVARALRDADPSVEMFGMGGRAMAAAGVHLLRDIDDLGVIGIAEVVRRLPFFFRLRDELAAAVRRERPDVLVCVDYPGFNMRLARTVHAQGVPVVYYIAPTIWAWHESRGHAIARDTDAVACIFPFEEAAYRAMGAHATFVGHPLLDTVRPTRSVEAAMRDFGARASARRVLLLPGSRRQEIERLLPSMLEAVRILGDRQEIQCFLPRATTIARERLESLIAAAGVEVTVTEGGVYDLMQIADAALAASGTVTLEAALMGLPTVLVYRVSSLTYWLGRRLVKTPYIGLPNIVAGRGVIPELLQDDATPTRMAEELTPLLSDGPRRREMVAALGEIRTRLGTPGAVMRVAELVRETAERAGR